MLACQRIPLELDEFQGCVAKLRSASEVFLSSTGGGVIAVSHLDGVAVGGRGAGDFGPITRQLQQAYWNLHDDPHLSEAVSYA